MAPCVRNHGYEVEAKIRRIFKGAESGRDEIDFLTGRCAYEVKACNLLNWTTNSNHRRSSKHAISRSTQVGRFVIKRENHVLLRVTSLEMRKQAMYVFVVALGKQYIMKRVPWEVVNDWVLPQKEYTIVSLRKVFGEEI